MTTNPPSIPQDLMLPVLAREALDFWFERAGQALGETYAGESMRKCWQMWAVDKEPLPGARPKAVKLKNDGTPKIAKVRKRDAQGRELLIRRMGAGVTGVILMDEKESVVVERFDGADAQRWRDAGFKLVEPDGGHVMHGIFEWMASPARSGKCLVFKMGKGNVLPKLQLCQPPYSYAICEPDKVIKFDARRIGALRSELLAAGLQACEKWFAYSRLVAEVATLVNELDSPRSRNLLNARSLELSKLSALFPKNLVLPRPGTDPQLILSAVLNKDPMRLAPTPSQPGCTSQSPSFDR